MVAIAMIAAHIPRILIAQTPQKQLSFIRKLRNLLLS